MRVNSSNDSGQIRPFLLWGMTASILLVLGMAIQAGKIDTKIAFDQELYDGIVADKVVNLDDLLTDFAIHQCECLPIILPSPDSGMEAYAPWPVYLFDSAGFTASFTKGLLPIKENGIIKYPITVYEEGLTHDRVVLNGMGVEIARVAPEPGYDPAWYVREVYPETYKYPNSAEDWAWMEAIFNPAKIYVRYALVDKANLTKYVLSVSAAPAIESADSAQKIPGGGITPMRAYTGPAVPRLAVTATELLSNSIRLTVAYPWVAGDPTNSFTNRIEFLSCSNLLDLWWEPCGSPVSVSSSTNWIEWTFMTSTNGVLRYFRACDADQDLDSDGLTDAREMMMYHTSVTTNDTDGDGLTDYFECVTNRTDPNSGDIAKPTISMDCPSNNYQWVYLP